MADPLVDAMLIASLRRLRSAAGCSLALATPAVLDG
jgi:hypothetical protein